MVAMHGVRAAGDLGTIGMRRVRCQPTDLGQEGQLVAGKCINVGWDGERRQCVALKALHALARAHA